MNAETNVEQQFVDVDNGGLHECIRFRRGDIHSKHSVECRIVLLCFQLPVLDVVQECPIPLELF